MTVHHLPKPIPDGDPNHKSKIIFVPGKSALPSAHLVLGSGGLRQQNPACSTVATDQSLECLQLGPKPYVLKAVCPLLARHVERSQGCVGNQSPSLQQRSTSIPENVASWKGGGLCTQPGLSFSPFLFSPTSLLHLSGIQPHSLLSCPTSPCCLWPPPATFEPHLFCVIYVSAFPRTLAITDIISHST